MAKKRKWSRSDVEVEQFCAFQLGWDQAQMGISREEAEFCSDRRPEDCPDSSSYWMDGYDRYFDYHRRPLTLMEWSNHETRGANMWRFLDPDLPPLPGEEDLISAQGEAFPKGLRGALS